MLHFILARDNIMALLDEARSNRNNANGNVVCFQICKIISKLMLTFCFRLCTNLRVRYFFNTSNIMSWDEIFGLFLCFLDYVILTSKSGRKSVRQVFGMSNIFKIITKNFFIAYKRAYDEKIGANLRGRYPFEGDKLLNFFVENSNPEVLYKICIEIHLVCFFFIHSDFYAGTLIYRYSLWNIFSYGFSLNLKFFQIHMNLSLLLTVLTLLESFCQDI